MTSAEIQMLLLLFERAVKAGYDVYTLLEDSNVTDEEWQKVKNQVAAANKRWEEIKAQGE